MRKAERRCREDCWGQLFPHVTPCCRTGRLPAAPRPGAVPSPSEAGGLFSVWLHSLHQSLMTGIGHSLFQHFFCSTFSFSSSLPQIIENLYFLSHLHTPHGAQMHNLEIQIRRIHGQRTPVRPAGQPWASSSSPCPVCGCLCVSQARSVSCVIIPLFTERVCFLLVIFGSSLFLSRTFLLEFRLDFMYI